MIRRTLCLSLALAGAVALTTGCAFTPARQKTQVVLQVSDPDPAKWNLALNNARNAQNDLGADKVDIEIVAYGPGIGMLRFDAATANRVSDAVKSGIKIVACENTMTAQKLNKSEMNPNISYVPAGVVHIMKRQHEGWAYVRP
jgi:uncharacterized protein